MTCANRLSSFRFYLWCIPSLNKYIYMKKKCVCNKHHENIKQEEKKATEIRKERKIQVTKHTANKHKLK